MRIAAATLITRFAAGQAGAQDSARAPRESIEVAIARGTTSDREELVRLGPPRINMSGKGFRLELRGPENRIVAAVQRNRKKYQTFIVDSVSATMAAAVMTVVATPMTRVTARGPSGEWVTGPAATAVVAYTVNGEERIVQPLSFETFDVEIAGMDPQPGEKRAVHQGKGMQATFALSDLPASGFEIRIVTDDSRKQEEFKYKVDAERRAAIR